MSDAKRAAAIDFFADIACPWCYVGWEALKRAAEARDNLALSVSWRNFLLNPDAPPEGYDRAEYLAKRFTDEARLVAIHDALTAAAESAGAPLNLEGAKRIPNTIDAHRVIHWAAGQGGAEAAIDALFAAHWVEGRDIADHATLAEIGERVGLDPSLLRELLANGADRDAILNLHNAAVKFGVTGVPVAIINRRAALMGAESPENYGKALDQTAASTN